MIAGMILFAAVLTVLGGVTATQAGRRAREACLRAYPTNNGERIG